MRLRNNPICSTDARAGLATGQRMSKLDKQALRQRGQQLRALLNEWDPIGVGPDGPKDEYDCLLWPVMRQLEAMPLRKSSAAFSRLSWKSTSATEAMLKALPPSWPSACVVRCELERHPGLDLAERRRTKNKQQSIRSRR